MISPKISRPKFPTGYVEQPKSFMTWEEVDKRLTDSRYYWICTVKPNHHPHVVPCWAVWVNEAIYFDGSPDTRHARNIIFNPYVALHLESGIETVILYGTAGVVDKPEEALARQISGQYKQKYQELGYAPEANQWETGGLFKITPYKVIAWTNFSENPTKFSFETNKKKEF